MPDDNTRSAGVLENKSGQVSTFIAGPVQMTVSAVCVSLMVYFAKLATETISGPEVTFFRLALGVSVALIMVKKRGLSLTGAYNRLLLIRGVVGGITVLLFFLAVEKGTVTNSTVLQNTFPLFAVLLSWYLLHEKASPRAITAMLIAFAGIVLLIRPDIHQMKSGDLLALASGITGGFAVTAIRQLRQNNVSVWVVFFYFCIFGALLSLGLSLPTWRWPLPGEWLLILATSLSGLVSQVTMTSAYKYCSTVLGGILSMGSSVFSFIIGVALLNERVEYIDLAAICLILAGSVIIILDEKTSAG